MSQPRSQPVQTSKGEVVVPFPGGLSDAALVAALKVRRPGAADVLFERYGRHVERLVVRVVGTDSEIPDLINEVFARACERVDRLDDASALKSWLGSIAVFTARTLLRDRRSRRRFLNFFAPEELPDLPVPGAPTEASAMLLRTYQILDTFPAEERVAFALRFMDGMGLNEIVEIMGISSGTVKRRLARAQERFVRAAEHDPWLRERVQQSQRWGQL